MKNPLRWERRRRKKRKWKGRGKGRRRNVKLEKRKLKWISVFHAFGSLPNNITNSACSHYVLRLRREWLPWWLSSKESTGQYRRHVFDLWVRNFPWRRTWQPTSIFLPGKSHGQRSLAGYSPWGHKKVRHNLVTKHTQ